jgi:hypothetical protein
MSDLEISIETISRIVSRPSVFTCFNKKKLGISKLINFAFYQCNSEEERFLLFVHYLDTLVKVSGIKNFRFSLSIIKRTYHDTESSVDDHFSVILWFDIPTRVLSIKDSEMDELFLENGLIHCMGKKDLLEKYIKLLVEKFELKGEFTDPKVNIASRLLVP